MIKNFTPHPSSLSPKLVDGRAELFGAELHVGDPLTRAGPPFAVYTWTGATLHVGAADGLPLDAAAALRNARPLAQRGQRHAQRRGARVSRQRLPARGVRRRA